MVPAMASEEPTGEIETTTEEELRMEWRSWLLREKLDKGPEGYQYVQYEEWLELMGIELLPREPLVEYPEIQPPGPRPIRDRTWGKYPWPEWTNGDEFEVRQGVDFTCSVASFRSYLYSYAVEHGLWVQTKRLSRREPLVWFQFREHEGR